RFLSAGTYQVQLKITNTTGCTDSVVHPLTVIGPVARYTIQSDSFGCEPLRVYFKNESSFATNYSWQFNDSSNAVLSTTSDSVFYFDYELYGNFVAKLTAQGSFNQNGITVTCESVFPDSNAWDSLRLISVYETPEASFTYETDCANKSAHFTNLSTTDHFSTLSYWWEFGDGDSSSESEPTHVYADTGHYFVVLHTLTERGCEDTSGIMIVIAPQPAAWFTYNEVCIGATTLFEDSTDAFNDLIYEWNWDFGDGGNSTLENPFHDFLKDSTDEVQLIVRNIGGCRDTVSRQIRIHSYPTANFSVQAVCEYDSARFQDLSSSSELPLTFSWDLGDGLTSSAANPVVKYNSDGVKLISQIIETPYGCSDTLTQSFTIHPAPVAGFRSNDSAQCFANHAFIVTDTSRINSGSYTLEWDFDDANTSSQAIDTHYYTSFGTYVISLRLSSDLGCNDTAQHTVYLYPQPEIGFIINQNKQCFNQNDYLFTDTSQVISGSLSRTWKAGDLSRSTDSLFNHQYGASGGY
ncbi:MAG: PKD domain-containing protein, partial [Bacteroidota bacterium]|nr:PKD domain-containing protein [Bacteroidota bacterium]MDX5429836.1 PKD domain-containing protein [Bacteroidota bacterium]MDX5468615.1 PKD domain-containing protein [Bacteroidota bacterium]